MRLPSRGEILTRTRQVVIVGAGFGGLCAAIALRKSGLEVVVLEQATEMREVGAGVLLWPNAMRVLQRLEVGTAVEDAGAAAADAALRSSRGTSLGAGPAAKVVAGVAAPTVVVHRGLLQTILLAALDRHVLRLGAKCVGVAQDAQGVTVSLADGSTAHGDLVVGPDGLHSQVRMVLVGDGPPRYSGYTAWRGIVPLDRSLADRLRPGESWGRGCLFGVAMLGGSQAYWWASARTGECVGGSSAEEKAAVERRFKIWHEPIPELIDATLEQAIVRSCQYDRPPLRRWSAGRVGLLGDAAHPMLASLGQGACQAIEDAGALDDAVGADSDLTLALRAYGARRAPHAAAGVPISGFAALQGLRDEGAVQPGQQVLVIGAAGGVGSFGVQLAKAFGAEVTGVASTSQVELVRSIGADEVIDYTRHDVTDGTRHWDLILDCAGRRTLSQLRRALTPKGTLVIVGGEGGGRWLGGFDRNLRAVALSRLVGQRLRMLSSKPGQADLQVLRELIEAGKVTPVIGRTYPLGETPEAIRQMAEGQGRGGKIVITV